jgi:hypothetical protein
VTVSSERIISASNDSNRCRRNCSQEYAAHFTPRILRKPASRRGFYTSLRPRTSIRGKTGFLASLTDSWTEGCHWVINIHIANSARSCPRGQASLNDSPP